ncbi:hypothetical protein CHLRE_02g074900v5 [Chlamydomonas reinhardtii]|uniref:C2 domain-containing protein n=1 Tax=Chlamydomonas reinhardtii TaxID=3055 RepID=A0A2K3E038_CHLRE|nr:uncharacterized protein CHLRE_02g074900v5 [Chlamydomonas reinhardtii]PNW86145.1 hypothetical protein CHLRE_02g074900v5 [Chlamydomonas reinhardtii]
MSLPQRGPGQLGSPPALTGSRRDLPTWGAWGVGPRLRAGCAWRRRVALRPAAALGVSEALAASWVDAAATSTAMRSSDVQSSQPGQPQQRGQQGREGAQPGAQRLAAPAAPMASATKLPAHSGVSAGGVVLGVLLTVALQMVARWLQRQRWARQVMELLDSRRSSGAAASTSTSSRLSSGDGMDDDAAAWGSWRPRDTSGGSSSRASLDRSTPGSGSADGESGAAAATLAFLGGSGVGGAGPGGAGTMDGLPSAPPNSPSAAAVAAAAAMGGLPPPPVGADPGESVEWVNMCWRKVWRVYQRGLERWIIDLLQPVFDGLVKDGSVPRWLCRLRVVELTLDHEAPYFSNMRRRNSRKDSDLNGVVDLRYTGGARMLLMLELGEGRWRFKVPVLVSDLDLECKMWLKLRLAPMCPWIGTISLAFVGPPNVKVQLSPYNRVRLMRVPVVQNYLRKLLTVDLPGLMVLPERLEINIPPSVTTIAEAAVGRDTIMRAVASAVLQADAVEAALLAALPLGPQTPAGGITLPEAFKGELSVTLREARNLPVWGFPGQSNPYCRLVLGDQAVQSRREGDTSHPGRHRAPVWNQEFQFLVEDPGVQVLEMLVKDSHLTGRTEVGRASIRLEDLIKAQQGAEGGKVSMWVPLQAPASSYGITAAEDVPTGEVLVELTYKDFDDDEQDSGYREAENFTKQAAAQAPITDIRSAAAASSRAAVAASAAVSAIAMTKAAAARAAARAARAAQEAAAAAAGAAKGAVDQGASIIVGQPGQGQAAGGKSPIQLPAGREPKALPAASGATTSAPAPPSESAVDAVVAGATDVETVAVAAARQRLRVLAEEAAAAAAAAASASSQAEAAEVAGAAVTAPKPRSVADSAAAVRRGRGGPRDDDHDDGGDGQGPGSGGGAAAAAPVLERIPALAVEARGGRSAGGTGSAGVSSAMVAGAASLPTSAAAATTVVLERPPARVAGASTASMEEELFAAAPGGGGGIGDGGVSSRHTLGVRPVLGGGSGDGARPSDAAAAGVQSPSGGQDGWSHVPPTQATANGNGAAALAQRHTGPGALVEAEADEQEWQSAPLQRGRLEDYDLVGGQGADAPATAAHGAAAGTMADRDGDAAGAQASSTAGGGGGGVMGALASLATVSAHSLSSITRGSRPPEASSSAPGAAADPGSSSGGSGGGGGTAWLDAIVSRLPRYKAHHDEDEVKRKQGASGKDGAAAAAAVKLDKDGVTAAAAAAGLESAGTAGEDHPWWQFWVPKGGTAKLNESQQQSGSSSSTSPSDSDGGASRPRAANADVTFSSTDGGAAANTPDGGKPWWQFWSWDDGGKAGKGKAGEGEAAGSGLNGGGAVGGEGEDGLGSKPVEAIYIPPDLPLEEIAAEVQRLKEDSWRERSDHVSSLWMKAVERNDRKWLMLAAFLLSVAVGLLTVVAWRLEQLEHLQAAAPQIALMTMQAALQVLEEQARSSGGL